MHAVIAWIPLALAAIQSPSTIQFENVRFVDESGSVEFVDPLVPLAVGRPGRLIGEFQFQSNRVSPNGSFLAPLLGVRWSVTDGNGEVNSSLPDGAWVGESTPIRAPIITEFDAVTGIGEARLELPVGTVVPDRFRYPHLFDGQSTIEVRIGWREQIANGPTGVPENVDWQGSLDTLGQWPEVWLEVEEPVEELGVATSLFVALDEPAVTTRVFNLSCLGPGKVDFEQSQLVFEPGMQVWQIHMEGTDPGPFRVRATEVGGGIWDSRACTALDDALFVFGLLGAAPGQGGITWNGGQITPLGGFVKLPPPPNYGNHKICKPASSFSSMTLTICGACVGPTGTPQANCPEFAYAMNPAKCVWSWSKTCTQAANANVSSPKFKYKGSSIVSCGNVSGEAGAGVGTPGGGHVEVDVGGQVELKKKCCEYEATGDSANVSWPNCS